MLEKHVVNINGVDYSFCLNNRSFHILDEKYNIDAFSINKASKVDKLIYCSLCANNATFKMPLFEMLDAFDDPKNAKAVETIYTAITPKETKKKMTLPEKLKNRKRKKAIGLIISKFLRPV